MGASWPQLLIIVVVVVLLFGTKKLGTLGSDLGASIKGFKKAMKDDKTKEESERDADFTDKNQLNKPRDVQKAEPKKQEKEQV